MIEIGIRPPDRIFRFIVAPPRPSTWYVLWPTIALALGLLTTAITAAVLLGFVIPLWAMPIQMGVQVLVGIRIGRRRVAKWYARYPQTADEIMLAGIQGWLEANRKAAPFN